MKGGFHRRKAVAPLKANLERTGKITDVSIAERRSLPGVSSFHRRKAVAPLKGTILRVSAVSIAERRWPH